MNGGANIPGSDRRRYEAVLRVSEGLSVCTEPEVLIEVLSERFREFVAIREASCQPISKSQLADDGHVPISIKLGTGNDASLHLAWWVTIAA